MNQQRIYGQVGNDNSASFVASRCQASLSYRKSPNHIPKSLLFAIKDTSMDTPLSNHRILILVGNIYEDLELWYPKLRLIEAGAEVTLAGPEARTVYDGKNGYPCTSDVAFSDVDPASFDGLIVPGGFMPDKLRRDKLVLDIVRHFTNRVS